MTRISATVLPIAAAALAVSALAGCKASSSSASGPASAAAGGAGTATAGGTPPPAATGAPPAAAAAGGLTGLPAACPTSARVSSLLGVAAGTLDGSKTGTTMDCVYGAPATVTINFSTAENLTPSSAEADVKAQGTTANFQSFPGIGDAAFYDTPSGGSYIAVLSGKLAFHVVVNSTVSADRFSALAKAILAG